jgi:hypothetical protein
MVNGHDARLSATQVRELQRLARSRRTPPFLARRAEIALDEHRVRSTVRPATPA